MCKESWEEFMSCQDTTRGDFFFFFFDMSKGDFSVNLNIFCTRRNYNHNIYLERLKMQQFYNITVQTVLNTVHIIP